MDDPFSGSSHYKMNGSGTEGSDPFTECLHTTAGETLRDFPSREPVCISSSLTQLFTQPLAERIYINTKIVLSLSISVFSLNIHIPARFLPNAFI